jgi:hypothetical protein
MEITGLVVKVRFSLLLTLLYDSYLKLASQPPIRAPFAQKKLVVTPVCVEKRRRVNFDRAQYV